MTIKHHIPNLLTCCNLLCGVLAIIHLFQNEFTIAFYLILIAGVFDFFDGFAARMLKVHSVIGKDLDSLADMVTFGIVPSLVMYLLIKIAVFSNSTENMLFIKYPILMYIPLIIAALSAVRLAKFNNDTRQMEYFIGLNTPSNTFLIASLPFIIQLQNNLTYPESVLSHIILNPINLCILSILSALLLVSEIPMLSLKFKTFGWQGNQFKWLLLSLSLVGLICFQLAVIPLIIILYIVLSIINNMFFRNPSL